MDTYYINNVQFMIGRKEIQVKNNYGNRIPFKNIETAREIYKAIRDGIIKVDKSYDAFPTVHEIRKMVNQLEGE